MDTYNSSNPGTPLKPPMPSFMQDGPRPDVMPIDGVGQNQTVRIEHLESALNSQRMQIVELQDVCKRLINFTGMSV